MFSVTKTFTFDYAHRLLLDYESKCKNLHGHTGKVEVTIIDENMLEPENNIMMNFVDLKEWLDEIKEQWDHKLFLNKNDSELINRLGNTIDLIQTNGNPTSELFAKDMTFRIAKKILGLKHKNGKEFSPKCVVKATFWETPTSYATHMFEVAELKKEYAIRSKEAINKFYEKRKKAQEKEKENSANTKIVETGIIVIKKNNDNSTVADQIKRRRDERKMLLGKHHDCKCGSKCKCSNKNPKKNIDEKVKPLINSILRNL